MKRQKLTPKKQMILSQQREIVQPSCLKFRVLKGGDDAAFDEDMALFLVNQGLEKHDKNIIFICGSKHSSQ